MNTKLALFLLALVSLTLPAGAQTSLLPERWNFTTGDDPAFSQVQFNDSSWRQIPVPSWWEREGFDGYDGIAWYRVRFTVAERYLTQQLYLVLGKIDDADQTYLNGVLIGSMGKFPPEQGSAWNQMRAYRLPPGLVKTKNVLAVRVYDSGGPGGIVADPIGIYTAKEYNAFMDPPPGPRKSFHQLVTSNGLIAAVYNERRGRIESVRLHIFQAYDSARYVQPFLEKLTPNIPRRPDKAFYNQHTHIITVAYGDVQINYFAPFTTLEKILYVAVLGPAEKVAKCSFTYEPRAETVLVDSVWLREPRGGAVKYFLFGFTDSLQNDTSVVARAGERLANTGGTILQEEVAWMRRTIERCPPPRGIRASERGVYEQSIAILKMAQVPDREVFPRSAGQILASLPPGGWNIAWVRDGMYAIMGLSRAGLFQEARDALRFCLNADAGYYVRYVYTDGKDYGVGTPYQISVCRYFGIGKEESDFNEAGPNIELDGFGLFLIAFSDYVNRSGDSAFFREHYARVAEKVGDVIIHCIDTNDVIRLDSGPWERHLPGKQFAYTSIACAAGLRDLGRLCARLGVEDGERYLNAFDRLVAGIRREFVVDKKLIKANVKATDTSSYDYFDGGTFEAFGFGLFTDSSFFSSHLQEYERALRVPGRRRGFSRINKGDWYDTAEWVFLDLRIASAMKKFGKIHDAQTLLDWVTEQAAFNHGLIPELLSERNAGYEGAIPMVGYGAGVYLLTLFDLHE
jgi:GH15 family glucan-1,4-alpha-glucosidase